MATLNRSGIFLAACGLALLAGCNGATGPATIAAKPLPAKGPVKVIAPAPKTDSKSKPKTSPKGETAVSVENKKPADKPLADAEVKPAKNREPELVAQVVAQPPPPKKEPKWKPTIAPQPARPTFAAPATKFDFVPGPVGDLLKAQLGDGAAAQLAPPRGKPSPQRDGPSPAVQAAAKEKVSLPVSAYAYEGALKGVERSKLPPTHPARDLPVIALNREPAIPSGAVMPLTALARGEIPPVPAVQLAVKKVEGKPAPPADPTREPAFAATIRITGPDVISPAPFQRFTLPNPFERSDEVRLRSEPLDTEVPGLLAGRIVERPVMPVPMPEPPKK